MTGSDDDDDAKTVIQKINPKLLKEAAEADAKEAEGEQGDDSEKTVVQKVSPGMFEQEAPSEESEDEVATLMQKVDKSSFAHKELDMEVGDEGSEEAPITIDEPTAAEDFGEKTVVMMEQSDDAPPLELSGDEPVEAQDSEAPGMAEVHDISKTVDDLPQEEADEINLNEIAEETPELAILKKPRKFNPPYMKKLMQGPMALLSRIDFKEILNKAQGLVSRLTGKDGQSPIKWSELLQGNKIIGDIFDATGRPKAHKAFIIALLVSATYSVGKIVAVLLLPQGKTQRSSIAPSQQDGEKENYSVGINQIKTANLFKAKEMEGEESVAATKKTTGPARPVKCIESDKSSSLPIKLVNTVVLQDTVKSMAAVEVRGNKDLLEVREGDSIEGLANVGRINRLNMIFKNANSGECEYIDNMDKEAEKLSKPFKILNPADGKKVLKNDDNSPIKNVGNQFSIKKTMRDEVLADPAEILTQAKAIQIKNPDGTLAFKMTNIVPGSVYSKLSIQEGDIITGINGKKITNLNEVLNLWGKLKDVDNVQLTIDRDGTEQNYDYDFD